MAALQAEFYVDGRALIRAIHARSSANIVHLPSSVKVDLFVAGGSAIDTDVLNRRVRIALGHRAGDAVWVHTPEDILLLKLWWFRRGGEVSDRQWRDVLSIVRVQGTRLDHRYLEAGAARLQVSDLLTRVLSQEAGR